MTTPSEQGLVLLHLLSINEIAKMRGDKMAEVRDVDAWGELTRIGAIDADGAITAVGREILGEVQP